MKKIIFILLLFCHSLLNGQILSKSDTFSIKGMIFSGRTRKQIDNVELYSNKQKLTSLTTDKMGKFEFPNLKNGKYSIRIPEYDYDSTLNVSYRKVEPIWIFIPGECEVNENIAKNDIQDCNPRLLLIGGIAPSYNVGQEKFEYKFGVTYYDFGCTPPDKKCVIDYNFVVFKYLDKKYGKKWHKDVRKDVIGYYEKY